MSKSDAVVSSSLLQNFFSIILDEIGEKNLPVVLSKSRLPIEWADSEYLKKINEKEAIESYAGLQKAVRAYYGRGARGILQRIGSKLWGKLLEAASFKEKAQAKFLKSLPTTRRRKSVLDLLVSLLDVDEGAISVHTLDLNLLLIDNSSLTTNNQYEDEAICYVTYGLIREAIYWATSKDPFIEEISCRAMGDESCEFKITFGEN